MKNNTSNKISITTLRVSKLLLNLLDRPMDYKEMFDIIEEKDENSVYTTEVLNKYLNTLRALGLKIEKIKGKYHLLNFMVEVGLTQNEIDAFNIIEEAVLRYGTTKNILTLLNIKRKLLMFLNSASQKGINNYINRDFTTKFGLLIKQFEKICDDELKIKIEYKGREYNVEPKNVIFSENKVFLECINTVSLEIKKFELEKVKLLEQQHSKNRNFQLPNSVIFEISGRLAEIYKLKNGETILSNSEGKLTIKSTNDDYEFLAKKLIRYKNNCKVLQPLSFKNYFVDYVKKTLERYL